MSEEVQVMSLSEKADQEVYMAFIQELARGLKDKAAQTYWIDETILHNLPEEDRLTSKEMIGRLFGRDVYVEKPNE